jgi:hypothetical protein
MSDNPVLIHGVRSIAKAINKPPRATYHLLENGRLPGAFQFGGSGPWSLDLRAFRNGVAELQQQARRGEAA